MESLIEDSTKAQDERSAIAKLIADGIQSGVVTPIGSTVFDKDQVQQAFRYMSAGKHTGKVVIKIRDEELIHFPKLTVKAIPCTLFSPVKSYIIIGGLGGFGLELLQWMVDKGARHVVVNSRRGLNNNYQKMVHQRLIRNQHVNIVINTCDAANEERSRNFN